MTMSPQRGLAEQLKEAGTKLLDPPTPVDELLGLLDHTENLLSRVDQSPAKSIQEAISPIVDAVMLDGLLRHSNVDVKVAVASCISEITRISAPEAPYDDDKMKDVFQLIVSAFEGLSDESSRSYYKRVLILETVAQVRSCVVMLDLECDALIVEMFKIFLATIRDYHPKNVFLAMETIMSLVLEESEDISSEILTPLLACMKKGNQEILPVAVKLAEKVFEKCAVILKPYLSDAIQSLEDYNEVVAAVCGGPPATVEPTSENPNPLVQKNVGEAISMDADENVSGRPNAVMVNGVHDNGKVSLGTGAKVENSVHASEKGQDNPSADMLASKSEDGESATQPLKLELKVEEANTINSSTNASESSDTPHFKNEGEKQEKDSSDSSRELDAVVVSKSSDVKAVNKEETPSLDFTSKKASKGKCVSDAKRRHSGEKATIAKKVKTSIDVDTSKKENKGMGDSEKKQMKQLGKKMAESSNTLDESSVGKSVVQHKTKPALEKEATKISAEDDLKKTPSTKSSLKSSKESRSLKETPGTSSKKKHAASEQKATESNLDASLVGTKVKVWWPDDKQFYEGVIRSYDPVKKKHEVLYDDGEKEILLLEKERWQIVDDDSSEEASGSQKRGKAKANPKSLGKPEKSDVSLKSGAAIQKSSGKNVDGNVVRSKQQGSDKRVDNSPKVSLKSKDAGGSMSKGKSNLDSPKTSSKAKQDCAKMDVKPKTKAHQAGHDSSAGKIRNKEKVADVAKTSGGKVKLSEMSKVQESEGSTKKRRKTG